MPVTQRKVCFVGTGGTTPTRKLERPEVDLAVEACRMAAMDAGLDPSVVDGINLQVHHYPPADITAITKGLGMKEVRYSTTGGGLSVGPAGDAAQALDAGKCNYSFVCKIMNTIAPSATPPIDPSTGGVKGPSQFEAPYGIGYSSQTVGFSMRRYMHNYGVTEEQLAWVPIVERRHALMNPRAYMKTPLTMEEYLESRFICEPARLFDCDIPVNGAFAYIMTTEDRAKALKQRPVYFAGWANAPTTVSDHYQSDHKEPLSPVAQILYRDTKLSPKDMDLWFVYDGYSFFVPLWMENLGLVPRGEAIRYIEGGERIAYNGEHPVNTHGGNLSEGRLHGAGHMLEAIQQLRGTAGPRQAKKADYVILSGAFPGTGPAGIMAREL